MASLVIYISSYPARPRRITVNYCRLHKLHSMKSYVFKKGVEIIFFKKADKNFNLSVFNVIVSILPKIIDDKKFLIAHKN